MDKKKRAEMARHHNATGLWRRLPFQYTHNSRIPQKKRHQMRCMLRTLKKMEVKNVAKKRYNKPKSGPSTTERDTMPEPEPEAKLVESQESKPEGLKSILKKVAPKQEKVQDQVQEQVKEQESNSAPRRPFPNLRGKEFRRQSRWSLGYDCE